MQDGELFHYSQQEETKGEVGNEQALQEMQGAYHAQRDQVI